MRWNAFWLALKGMPRGLWSVNKLVIKLSIFITVASTTVFILNSYLPINQLLASSIITPWGVVTSIVAHASVAHITLNLIFLWAWTFLIAMQNDILKYSVLSKEEISKRLKFSMWSVLAAAILADILWSIVLHPGSTSLGSSGVVYGFVGVSFAFALMNVSFVFKRMKRSDLRSMVGIVNIAGNLLMNFMIFFFIYGMVSNASSFFGVGDPQTNYFVHIVSFMISFFAVLAYEYYLFHLPTLVKNFRNYKSML